MQALKTVAWTKMASCIEWSCMLLLLHFRAYCYFCARCVWWVLGSSGSISDVVMLHGFAWYHKYHKVHYDIECHHKVHYDIASWVAHSSVKGFWRRSLKSEYCESDLRINVTSCATSTACCRCWDKVLWCWDRVLPSLLLTMIFQFQPPAPGCFASQMFSSFSFCFAILDVIAFQTVWALIALLRGSNRPIHGFINWAQLATFSQIMPRHNRLNTILSPIIGFLCKNKQIWKVPKTCCLKNTLTYFPTFQHTFQPQSLQKIFSSFPVCQRIWATFILAAISAGYYTEYEESQMRNRRFDMGRDFTKIVAGWKTHFSSCSTPSLAMSHPHLHPE